MIPQEPYDSLWTNGRLVTLANDDGYGIIENGAVAVKEGRIIWVGPADLLETGNHEAAATVKDLRGAWVTPGFVDCHTHLVYAGNRANEFEMRLNGADYSAIAKAGGGIVSTVRAVREATEEELFAQSLKRLQAMMADGITTLEIKSGYGLDTPTELKMLKVIRRLNDETPLTVVPTFLGAHTVPPEFKGRSDDYVDLVTDEIMPLVAEQKLAAAVDVFCENIGFTLSQTERVFQAATAHDLPVKLHAEQLSDSKGSLLAARYNALSVDHLEYLDPGDIPALAQSGCVAVLLPGAFYYLNETVKPPVEALRRAGVPMAVSTDANPGTSPILSVRTAMNMASVLFGLTPYEALAGATTHGAKALGLENGIGSLESGKAADFLIWEIDSPADLVYQLGGRLLRGVIKGGRWLR